MSDNAVPVMSPGNGKSSNHRWRFFRAGGFDQVRLESAADIAHLHELDQKLWVALACPVSSLEFDARTLALLDADGDGRIRAPDVVAAARWTTALIKNGDSLARGSAELPLASIDDQTAEGKILLSSAKQILANLGKADASAISVEDTSDTVRIFAQTKFNGDGIIPPDVPEDQKLQGIINDVIVCMGSETDRSGKPGISQPKVDLFFADTTAYAAWQARSAGLPGTGAEARPIMPLGANTPAAAEALKAVMGKVEDYFARCRLAAFDSRATAAVNMSADEFNAIAAKNLSLAGSEFASLPLARIEPGRPLPLVEGINPGWRAAMERFRIQVVVPLLGEKQSVSETDWEILVAKFAPFDAWLAEKAGATVEKLGGERIAEILNYKTADGNSAKDAITALIARDAALAPEAQNITQVERLVRYHRDLFHFLNNFVAFRDFYSRRGKSIFQAGVLYLDQRSCELCIRVEDAARHGAMAHLSYAYLAYCDLTRKSTGEAMTVACAFTAGDSDNLMVGRNGVFYDRKGRDWDATITKLVEHPISIRQAFWSPYKRLVRWIEDQVAKRAAAADSASTNRLSGAASQFETTVTTPGAPAAPAPAATAPPAKKVDIGVVAALGVAFAGITTALGVLLNWLGGVPLAVIPLYIVGVMLLISMPSMIMAAPALRQRNLGPILDANGWAVNAKAKINIPFGGSLTQVPRLPPGSHRDSFDAFAETHRIRNGIIVALVILVAAGLCWYFGLTERVLPNVFPKSPYVRRVEEAQSKSASPGPAATVPATTPATTPAETPVPR